MRVIVSYKQDFLLKIIKNEKYSACRNELEFKKKNLKDWFSNKKFFSFCIETAQTIWGFPDVLVFDREQEKTYYIEYKFTNTGIIKFQPTQIAFFKKYKGLGVICISYNKKNKNVYVFDVENFVHGDTMNLEKDLG